MNESPNASFSNENGLDYLSRIINEVAGSDTVDTSKQTEAQNDSSTDSASQQPSSDFISTILSNPDILSKLPSLISSIKPIMEMFGKTQSIPTQSKAREESADGTVQASTQSVSIAKTMGDSSRRAALLCAMKPYLNRERQDTIDYIIKISRLGDVLKSL
jgi:hypothetical protein